jgi:hypothetical protein
MDFQAYIDDDGLEELYEVIVSYQLSRSQETS